MAAKNSKIAKASTSSAPAKLEDNSIAIGTGSKAKIIKITGVSNGVAINPNDCGITAVTKSPVPFKSSTQNLSSFSLKSYKDYCNVNTVAAYLSKSKELKEDLLKSNIVLTPSAGKSLIVVKDLTESSVANVVSFNKACAIMSSGILKHTFDREFDWKIGKYVDTHNESRVIPDHEIVNRLAGQLGLTPSSPYYWMIVPGYEFLYELYPAEVLAYTLVRLEFRDNLNLPSKITDSDIVSSLVMKMNRLHDLNSNEFDDVFNKIGKDAVEGAFIELAKDVGSTSKTKRNYEAIIRFKELIENFKPTLQAARLKDYAE